MATNRIPSEEDPKRPAPRGQTQRQAPAPVQTPGTAPTNSAAAPVGTAARPSPNPISPVRPAMNPPMQQQAQAPQPTYPVRPAYTPRVGEIGGGIDVRSYTGSMWPQLNPANAGPMAPRPIAPVAPRNDPAAMIDPTMRQPSRTPPNERGAQPAPPLPTPRAPTPQTEASNPLTGPLSPQMEDTTDELDGAAMGFSNRGRAVPAGTDATNYSANVGGTGMFARSFKSPGAAGIYGDYVRRLFA